MARPIVLIGAEFEENLSLRYLASAVQADGFETHIVPFNEASATRAITEQMHALDPLVVGISIPSSCAHANSWSWRSRSVRAVCARISR